MKCNIDYSSDYWKQNDVERLFDQLKNDQGSVIYKEKFKTVLLNLDRIMNGAEWVEFETLEPHLYKSQKLLPLHLHSLFANSVLKLIRMHYTWKMPAPLDLDLIEDYLLTEHSLQIKNPKSKTANWPVKWEKGKMTQRVFLLLNRFRYDAGLEKRLQHGELKRNPEKYGARSYLAYLELHKKKPTFDEMEQVVQLLDNEPTAQALAIKEMKRIQESEVGN